MVVWNEVYKPTESIKEYELLDMREINKIIIHCSDTPEDRDDKMEDIRRWHINQGYKDIGYHYVIELDGTIKIGRPIGKIGAHCKKHNSDSIGICYVGGKNKEFTRSKDTRTDKQKESLLKLLKELKGEFPNIEIYGHKDFANKECPCFDARGEYMNI